MNHTKIQTIGIIGFGNMAEALFKGLKKKNPQIQLLILEKSASRIDLASKKYNATDLTATPDLFFSQSECVVLATKPQDLKPFLATHKTYLKGQRVISILAGTALSTFTSVCPDTEFARCMPNLAASVGKAVTGLCFSENASDLCKAQARLVVSAMGSCIEIPETLMPGVTALSGSGIALVFEFINAMAMGAVRTGIKYDEAYPATLEVLSGAIEVLKKEGIHPSEMVSKVCSPAGTTIEGIKALEDGAFTSIVMNALQAIYVRSRELELPK